MALPSIDEALGKTKSSKKNVAKIKNTTPSKTQGRLPSIEEALGANKKATTKTVSSKKVTQAKKKSTPKQDGYTGVGKVASTMADFLLNKPREVSQRVVANQWDKLKSNPIQAISDAITLQAIPKAIDDVTIGKRGLSGEDVTKKTGSKVLGIGYDIVTDPLTYVGGAGALSKGTTVAKIAKGAGIGAGFGAGQAIADEQSAGDVAKYALIGGAIGGGLTGVAEGVSKTIAKKAVGKTSKLPSVAEALDEVKPVKELEPTKPIRDISLKETEPNNPIKDIASTEPINGVKPITNAIPANKDIMPKTDIDVTEVERGFSRNTRTDMNNPDNLRDSFTENPLTYEQLANEETLGKAQTIFDQGFETARTQLSDLASRMQPEAIPLAKMLSRKASEDGNIEGAREIISEVAEKLTQAGQFSQAAKILRDADPETFLMTITKQLKKLNKEGQKTYGDKWKKVDLTPEELDAINNIERGNQESYETVFEQIGSRIGNELPSSAMEKVNAWRHIAMLLNPKTHIRNAGGNVIMMGMRKSAGKISAILQNVLLPAEQRTQVFKVSDEYKQLASDFFDANRKDLLAGSNKYDEGLKLGKGILRDKRVFKTDMLDRLRKFNYGLLEAEDTPFFRNAYVDRLASYAQSKGITDFSKLPQAAFDTAYKEAEDATYKDASGLASFLNKVKHPGAKANPLENALAIGTEAALPFTKTPINIIKRGIEYSPAGILKSYGRWKTPEGIDDLAKGMAGSGVVGLGYLLASIGFLTGKTPKDKDLKEYDKSTEHYPFSVAGKFTYDWAMPFAVPLAIGVEIYNTLKGTEDEAKMDKVVADNDTDKLMELSLAASNVILDSLSASTDTAFNMSVFKGLKTLLANPNGVSAGLAQLPQGYASQFIPTAFGQLAGAIDPVVRQSYVQDDLGGSMKAMALSKIPGASFYAEPKQTPFGEDVKRIQDPLGRTMAQFLSPANIAVDQGVDPVVDKELRRLADMGYTSQLPTMVPNYIEKTQKHPKIMLTPSETTEYQKRTGQLTLEAFKRIINSGRYRNARGRKNMSADEVKSKILAEAISEAKAKAKDEILRKKGYRVH